MLKFLISATNEIRVETMQDVEALHKQLQDEADEIGCLLNNFSWTQKENKKTDEIYYQVKYKFIFNSLRDPDFALDSITYKQKQQADIGE